MAVPFQPEWINYTPTSIVGQSGLIINNVSVNYCRYKLERDLIWIDAQILGDISGDLNGQINISLPTNILGAPNGTQVRPATLFDGGHLVVGMVSIGSSGTYFTVFGKNGGWNGGPNSGLWSLAIFRRTYT